MTGVQAGPYGGPESPVTLVVGMDGRIQRAQVAQLPTLGGTAIEVVDLPFMPPVAWGCVFFSAVVIIAAVLRPVPGSERVVKRPNTFRAAPGEA